MDIEVFQAQYLPRLKKNWLPLGLALLGMIFFVYGLIGLMGSASKSNEIKFEKQDAVLNSQGYIAIDIEGAVVKPGVYKLNQGAIIQEALVAAGGLSEEADRDFVAKNINLAAKLSDGAKLYLPRKNEVDSQSKTQVLSSGVNSGSGLININSASTESLDTLPGIGTVTAQKIINNRPYTTIEQLLDKKVVSQKVFTQIKDRITAY